MTMSKVENVRGVTSRFAHLEKSGLNFYPCQSSPSLTILVPLWFIVISLVFFYRGKVLFSGFLHFRGNFVHCPQTNSKYMYCD